jgi:hypothetical protein
MRAGCGNTFGMMRLMLPEHRDVMGERDVRAGRGARPAFSEDHWDELQRRVTQALRTRERVRVRVWDVRQGREVDAGSGTLVTRGAVLGIEDGTGWRRLDPGTVVQVNPVDGG